MSFTLSSDAEGWILESFEDNALIYEKRVVRKIVKIAKTENEEANAESEKK